MRKEVNRRTKLYFAAITATFASYSNLSFAEDWYLSVGSTCSGPTAVNAAIATYLNKGLSLKAIPPAGNFAVQVAASELRDYIATNPYPYNSFTFDENKAATFRKILKNSTDKVPFLFKVSNSFFLNFVVPNIPLNVAAGVLFEYFYQSVDAEPLALENLHGYIAAGGKLDQTISIRKSQNGGRFMITQTSYIVAVGNETRMFVISACQFPVAVKVSEFQTTGPFNNKVVKPRPDGTWGVFDLTDNKWDSTILKYVGQQPDFYVFEADEVENNHVVGQTTHRLSVVGGPWSRKRSDSADFANLYLKIDAK